ncbi:hypothetical protein CVS40_6513 [Lucilia cuprina]|nr:hypothetical protein CVS40_6513 [Lucilia cuprina]
MGANKNSDLQKCGEILIDIKRIKYKTKTYTYRCGFCTVNCEQLKKFTKHLEDKHFKNLEQELKDVPIQIEPEISRLSSDPEDFKMEQRIYIVETNDNVVEPNNSIETNVYSDPLNMLKIETSDDEHNKYDNDCTMSCNVSSSETEDNGTNYINKKIKDEQNTKKYNITPKVIKNICTVNQLSFLPTFFKRILFFCS